MHYGAFDFARDRTRPTLQTLKSFNGLLGQRERLSYLDIRKLNVAYECGGKNSLMMMPNKAPPMRQAPVIITPTPIVRQDDDGYYLYYYYD